MQDNTSYGISKSKSVASSEAVLCRTRAGDVGGGADEETIAHAFRIVLTDPSVRGILVNIFGGIMKCDIIARGILAAAEKVELKVPLVVRLEGTRVEEGRAILAESGLDITPAASLDEGARLVCEAVEGKS